MPTHAIVLDLTKLPAEMLEPLANAAAGTGRTSTVIEAEIKRRKVIPAAFIMSPYGIAFIARNVTTDSGGDYHAEQYWAVGPGQMLSEQNFGSGMWAETATVYPISEDMLPS